MGKQKTKIWLVGRILVNNKEACHDIFQFNSVSCARVISALYWYSNLL